VLHRRARIIALAAATLAAILAATLDPAIVAAAKPPAGPIVGEPYIVAFGTARSIDDPRDALREARARGPDRAVERAMAAIGIRPQTRYRSALHGFAASLTPDQIARLRRDPSVRAIVPDRVIEPEAGPAEPGAESSGVVTASLDHQRVPTGVRRVNANDSPVAHIDGVDDPLDVDIAILDSGIDAHPDLDIRGGFDCMSPFPSAWRDRYGHGTHVSGTAAAIDDGAGVVGVAPGARLWAVKVLDDNDRGRLSWYLCGVDRVMSMRDPDDPSRPRIEVVNMSLSALMPQGSEDDCGTRADDLLHQAICASVADGTTYVVAAGNQSDNAKGRAPGAYDEVITVSALADFDGRPGGQGRQRDICPWYSADSDDTFANFSNYGPDIDLIAPGKCILSTYPGGRWASMSGTSMATPAVTGAVALYIASHPGVRPGQVKAALQHVATLDWRTGTDPDGHPDRLLDVSSFDDPPDFSVDRAPGPLRLGRGGRLDVPLRVRHVHGHRASVALSATGLPGGVAATFRAGADGDPVLVLMGDGTIGGGGQVSVQGTDGELVRTLDIAVDLVAGDVIAFSSPPTGGPTVVDGDDPVVVAFSETDDGPGPTARRVQRQWAMPRTAGSCGGAPWEDDGPAAAPADLDPDGSPGSGWSFSVGDLARDGCYRWVVSLLDADGTPMSWTSAGVIVDRAAPRPPGVVATGPGVWQDGKNGTVWVRAGRGTLTLRALGRDASGGVARSRFGPLTRPAGWSFDPGPAAGDPASVTLAWGPGATSASLDVTSVDVSGREGGARTIQLRVDSRGPTGAAWTSPSGGTWLEAGTPDLRWLPGSDGGSGFASAQRIQRQRGAIVHPRSCAGVRWRNDGGPFLGARPYQDFGLRSGYCYRWKLTALDRVGNRGPTRISGAVLLDTRFPRADFLAPDEGTTRTQASLTVRVRWRASDSGGSGALSWVLERERKRLDASGECTGVAWRKDGSTRAVRSPLTERRLTPGSCYRWRLVLEDGAGNVGTDISGVVQVTP
jgi:subtilisin family serine protease